MKTFNKTLIAAATITTFGLAAAPAAVSLEASASLATSYLWRGTELGNGDAALAVDLSGSTGAISYGYGYLLVIQQALSMISMLAMVVL